MLSQLSYQSHTLMHCYFITVAGLQRAQNNNFFAQFIIEQKNVSDSINIALNKIQCANVTESYVSR